MSSLWSRASALSRIALSALSVWAILVFTYVVSERLRLPIELEWMGGGMLDHVERVRDGKSLYVAPSAEYVPFIYPPLYFWLAGLAARVLPTLIAARLVSIVCTLFSAGLVHALARRLGASRTHAFVAVGLFFGGYSLTNYWYDLERCDSLCVTLLLASTWVLSRFRCAYGAAGAGALVGLAFFAKQPALPFLLWPTVAFVLARRFRHAAAFGGAGVAVLLAIGGPLTQATGGWFWYYCVKLPSSHGIDLDLLTGLITEDFGKSGLLLVATLVACAWTAHRLYLRDPELRGDTATLGAVAFLFAGLGSSVTSRLHVGGWSNVLIFWIAFACVATAVLASRIDAALGKTWPATPTLLALLLLQQMSHLAYDPKLAAPDRRRLEDQRMFEATVREWEKTGEVVVHGRGQITTPRHFHIMGLIDVLRSGAPVPADLVEALKTRRYAAYVIDELGELGLEPILGKRSELYELIVRNYYIALKLDDRERPPVVGWIAHPTWVFRPRQVPLTGTIDTLERRLRIEMGLAELQMREVQAGVRRFDAQPTENEGSAAAIDARRTME